MIRNLLVLPNGEEIFSGSAEENGIRSVALTQCVNGEEELCPGAVCASMLEASVIAQGDIPLAAGDEITLYTVSDSGTRTKQGIFVAEKPVWESACVYQLTAYDRVSLLDKDLTDWLTALSGWPYCLLDFASMVCSECGLTLINDSIPNGDYPVQAFSGEGITGRQIMQWAGQAAGRFCRATTDGQLEFAWYEQNKDVFGPAQRNEQLGPDGIAVLKNMATGTQLQAVTEIEPSLSGVKEINMYRTGRNILDVQTAGIYHSNNDGYVRHTLKITDTGIRLDVTSQMKLADTTRWGFCIGTPKKLAGKTITFSGDFATSKTDIRALPYLSFIATDVIPVAGRFASYSSLLGGFINGATAKTLAYRSGSGVRSVTYTVTGEEDYDHIGVVVCFCDPNKGTSTLGDWTEWSNLQVEISDTATEYEPYTADTFTRTINVANYGGRMNWSTGVLTTTHGRIASYDGEEVPDGWISSTGELSQGAQVVYPLETPKTFKYAAREVLSLGGTNTLHSDTGGTSVEFQQAYYFQNGLRFEDYTVTPVEKVQIRLTEDDIGAVYPDTAEACNTYILSGNYLLTNQDPSALEGVAQTLYEQLKDITYTPCRLELPASAGVETGDIITVMDRNGKEIRTYVMSKKRAGQRDVLECTGSPRRDSSTAVNSQSYKALSGKVLELRTDIEGLRAEHRDAQGSFSDLALTVEGIATEVSRQQTGAEHLAQQLTSIQQTAEGISLAVQSIQTGGVSRVKTEMGYTFDDEGLKISRSNAEMSNLLDNTGMYVKRGDDIVLQASNEGVQAVNIAVHNYLTVGSHARFEDYNDGTDSRRTACFFYLGG